MHELIKQQLKDFQSGFNDFTKRKPTTSNKKTSFRLPTTKNKTTSPITTAKKVTLTSKSKKLSPRTTEESGKNKKDSVTLPLNETTISSLDLTVITPLTPRREKNKGKNDNYNNKSNNYKNGSRHCQRRPLHCRGCSGGGDCVDGDEFDGYERKPRKNEEQSRQTISAATSPFKIKHDCGCSPFNSSRWEANERVDSGRKSHDGRFKKKEKISDFVDFIELLSEYFTFVCM